MIIFQRHDTEYINGLKKDQEFFLTLRSEHVFDGIGEACEETLMLLKTEIEGKIKEYEQNYGIDFETGRALSPVAGGEPEGAGTVARDADQIFD